MTSTDRWNYTKATASDENGYACVEIGRNAAKPSAIRIRDSKASLDSPVLSFDSSAFTAFLAHLR